MKLRICLITLALAGSSALAADPPASRENQDSGNQPAASPRPLPSQPGQHRLSPLPQTRLPPPCSQCRDGRTAHANPGTVAAHGDLVHGNG
jgi:hypothetical protein